MATKTAKTATKTAKATKTATPKTELAICKPQARILDALNRASGPLNNRKMAEKSGVAETWITGHVIAAGKANVKKSLLEQGFVATKEIDVDGRKERVCSITGPGKKALAAFLATGKKLK